MKDKLTNKILIPVFIAVFLALVLLSYFIPRALSKSGGAAVRVYKGSQIIEEIDLSKVSKSYEIDLKTNKILVEKDGVSMKGAKCPDLLCVHQGKISKPGESIVCLPNKIMIEIAGKKDNVDAVAGAR